MIVNETVLEQMIDSPIIIILSEFYHRPHLLLFLLDEDGWERERDKIPKISIRNTNISEHVCRDSNLE